MHMYNFNVNDVQHFNKQGQVCVAQVMGGGYYHIWAI